MSNKYIIRNCNSFNGYCNWCRDKQKHCKDITDCLLKQIVEKCKNFEDKWADGDWSNGLSEEILDMLEIEEIESEV